MVLAPRRKVTCPKCRSTNARLSSRTSLAGWLGSLVGVRSLRCQRCYSRFSAFALGLRQVEPDAKPTAGAVLPQPAAPMVVPEAAAQRPLEEIELIEREWRRKVQPQGLIEETLCSQLAHATWHLRSLQRAERDAIAASVSSGRFNGEHVMGMMHWRLSAEQAVNSALEQLQSCRAVRPSELPAPAADDLLALSRTINFHEPISVGHHAAA